MEFKLSSLSFSEIGKRSNQEDSIYPPTLGNSVDGSLYILCDGMGGHEAGEVASATVCQTMGRYIEEHFSSGEFTEADFNKALDAAYDALDEKDNAEVRKMGTTLTFVKFHEGGCFVAHIGDSRVYHIRPSEKRILHVTSDHSLVNDLVKVGELTPEQARTSRQKNIITRAMQPHQERRARADIMNLTDLRPGDYLFMCSDGVLEQMEDAQLVNILSMKATDSKKIEVLRGSTADNADNHTAWMINVEAVLDGAVPSKAEGAESPETKESGSGAFWTIALLVLAILLVVLFIKFF